MGHAGSNYPIETICVILSFIFDWIYIQVSSNVRLFFVMSPYVNLPNFIFIPSP